MTTLALDTVNMEGPKASNLHTPNIDNIVDEENPFFGYVSSLERALEIVRDYEMRQRRNSQSTRKLNTLELPVFL